MTTTRRSRLERERPIRGLASGLALLNLACGLWLATAALAYGLPFGAGHDPYAMRWGATLLAVALMLAGVGAVMTARMLRRVPIDDGLALSMACQGLPPVVLIAYAALT